MPREHDQHAVRDRQRAARQPRAGAAGHPRHLGRVARADHVADLLGAAGQHRDRGALLVLRQSV